MANIALWLVQALLAFAFFMAGMMKLGTPISELASQMAWVELFPAWMVRFIGLSEVLGAIGLILPSALRVYPKLTPAAAFGLLVVMLLAAPMHIYLGEVGATLPNVVLGGLAAVVLWGRLIKAPITPRGGFSLQSHPGSVESHA